MPPINAERLWQRVQKLSTFTDPDAPWTRRAFTSRFLAARQWLREQMEEAGLEVSQDAAGNLVGRGGGGDAAAPPIVIGSHCDTVEHGGRFDGTIGVLSGIEVAQAMRESGTALSHPLEVIDFLSEEPSDYGISCVGSRAFSGVLDARMLAARRADGETLAEGLRRIGARPEALSQPLRQAGHIAAYVELHIEQGPVLETRGLPIGVVTHIVGIRRVSISVAGRPDHAGTIPMDLRHDALVGAARLIQAAYLQARGFEGKDCYVVATVGRIAVTPNMPNAVPGKVDMVLEVRSDDDGVLATFPERLLEENSAWLAQAGVSAEISPLSSSGVTHCSPLVVDAVERSANALGYASTRLPSGAGHDGVYVSRTGPVGMIFIPCLQGRSHCPEESIEPEQLLDGTRVLFQTIVELDKHGECKPARKPQYRAQASIKTRRNR